ncbi:hypothetical protein [Blastococcus sp. PRF04-17]|uniref:hypothetical protein n=1 Tax=Blastococcus sp. PRF04-17 TaxID=2933797 RepID=UPI001FF61707|nr:hypothetical protein [Blastococcus sp. PRF04-17]UOY02982.1 hypothetical protein MVA48_06430 [Blastococcus sp. PRF04-17]
MNPGTDWIDQARRLLDLLRSGDATDGTHASDCQWCPVCKAAAVVRGERPDVTEALADLLTATSTALRSFAEAAAPAHAPEDPAADADEAQPPPPVQQIEIA